MAVASVCVAGLRPLAQLPGTRPLSRFLETRTRGPAPLGHSRALTAHPACRIACRRWRLSAALKAPGSSPSNREQDGPEQGVFHVASYPAAVGSVLWAATLGVTPEGPARGR